MITPSLPENEKQRQRAVERYVLLDSLPESSYDEITALASLITDAPISLITLLHSDRNFFKSHYGLPFNQSPRNISFCGHAIISDHPITIIEDARKDDRFHDNPLVLEQGAVFYAGVPLVDPQGYRLGTLCIFDTKPKTLDHKQIATLKVLANQVVRLFEERVANMKLEALKEELVLRNENLRKFANVISHDLKSPLANITSLIDLLEDDFKELASPQSLEYLQYLKSSSNSLRDYIDGLLIFYSNSELAESNKVSMKFEDYMEHIKNLCHINREKVTFNYSKNVGDIVVNKSALSQILMNLITNSIKYNDKEVTVIDVACTSNENDYIFEVKDNGPGIPADKKDVVFNLFSVIGEDKYKNKGTGIGLATVKKLVENLGGNIRISLPESGGCIFTFNLKRSDN
ncbi:GAF domain-containing sensor histidine kinase [Bizionia argentinensis JUB59]|uniref:histidine kinase n=1 Tax=Bizionia argentinensis JUB59 TaxID=1046627 RepID=G2EHJ0_9FLAO|nr:GAF domain-containing sensor histidine kinase [Bizionia argentinensis]EGV42102.1 GAF domain-containing sensor histidine kinase [Bizionia argentinensis JUB59]